jgi:hypothetical protein
MGTHVDLTCFVSAGGLAYYALTNSGKGKKSAKVAILDAGAQYGKLIDRRVRELNVEVCTYAHATRVVHAVCLRLGTPLCACALRRLGDNANPTRNAKRPTRTQRALICLAAHTRSQTCYLWIHPRKSSGTTAPSSLVAARSATPRPKTQKPKLQPQHPKPLTSSA